MKSIDVNSSTSIDFHVENNEKDTKFKFRNKVKILKFKNIYYFSFLSDHLLVLHKKIFDCLLCLPLLYLPLLAYICISMDKNTSQMTDYKIT